MMMNGRLDGHIAVSYTHLDVYKRQEQFLYNYPILIIELLDIKTVLLIYIG